MAYEMNTYADEDYRLSELGKLIKVCKRKQLFGTLISVCCCMCLVMMYLFYRFIRCIRALTSCKQLTSLRGA